MESAHMKSVEEIFKSYGVSDTTGLDPAAVEQAQLKYGLNGELDFVCITDDVFYVQVL